MRVVDAVAAVQNQAADLPLLGPEQFGRLAEGWCSDAVAAGLAPVVAMRPRLGAW